MGGEQHRHAVKATSTHQIDAGQIDAGQIDAGGSVSVSHYGHGSVKVRSPGLGSRVRVRSWAFDDEVVQLSLADQALVPRPDELAQWIDAVVDATTPLRAIRTGALYPGAAARFADAGFEVIDTLALLRLDLRTRAVEPGPVPRTSRLRTRGHREAADVDRAAFGTAWANNPRDLGEIRRATPLHHATARFVPSSERRRLAAFAISGAASGQGYLQRLAVHPDHQRVGHGRALAAEALRWMRRKRLTHAVVNTAVDNEPALALYAALGFHRLPERLVVMQLDVGSDER
ncbi:MAG: GNAT family N-acetyltransferase [Ilumatobacteraceae bacterium]